MIQSALISSLLNLVSKPGIIYLDIEDLEIFFKKAPTFSVGISEKEGGDRAEKAIEEAISSIKNTTELDHILVIISTKEDIELTEYCKVSSVAQLNENINLKCGVVRDDSLGDKMRVVVFGA